MKAVNNALDQKKGSGRGEGRDGGRGGRDGYDRGRDGGEMGAETAAMLHVPDLVQGAEKAELVRLH
eukprot:CAMPEP_0114680968 /NCGR_PEP_ID=MMETSP0191-20121206/54802_1 /TAXON_ID=126664 /ORGANISM="Sorites sp." /LENGTH=65 /DNA_ID=CAMNT_0001958569 /DNA_START=29 /DNA_END=227 /DNA_ORIENTATION=+